jgi:hypothetical protein
MFVVGITTNYVPALSNERKQKEKAKNKNVAVL